MGIQLRSVKLTPDLIARAKSRGHKGIKAIRQFAKRSIAAQKGYQTRLANKRSISAKKAAQTRKLKSQGIPLEDIKRARKKGYTDTSKILQYSKRSQAQKRVWAMRRASKLDKPVHTPKLKPEQIRGPRLPKRPTPQQVLSYMDEVGRRIVSAFGENMASYSSALNIDGTVDVEWQISGRPKPGYFRYWERIKMPFNTYAGGYVVLPPSTDDSIKTEYKFLLGKPTAQVYPQNYLEVANVFEAIKDVDKNITKSHGEPVSWAVRLRWPTKPFRD